MTIQQDGREPYQGIVALEGVTLAESIERYFAQSEQLPTRLWLFADQQRAGGLFVQALPGRACAAEDWRRIGFLAETLTDRELLELPAEKLLFRLFHEERVRLLEPEPVVFRCGCSRERIEGVLAALGQDEIQTVLAEQGSISVDCEFCNRRYVFDAVDIGSLFAGGSRAGAPATRQ
jgi:molecular chaperone Hsp33